MTFEPEVEVLEPCGHPVACLGKNTHGEKECLWCAEVTSLNYDIEFMTRLSKKMQE